MEGIYLIQDLAIVLLAAGIAGAVCRRLGLSVVVGYLVAGVVVGPYTPPFSLVSDTGRIQTLAQVGLVFLMFGIGLGLSITKLRRLGWGTLLATGMGAAIMLGLTQALGKGLGWTPLQALFIAAMFMVSSSAVISKIVGELNLSHDRSAQFALGITVIEDVVAVVMLTVLASQTGGNAANVGSLLTGMTAFVVLLLAVGLLMVPGLLRRLEARADPELQTIIVAGVLFLLAIAAANAGYSLALGAFLLGAIVAEIPQKIAVEKAFVGMRDLFSAVFFVAIGMMIDVRLLADVWPLAIGLGVFVIVGRAIATGLALILCGTRPAEARRAGLLLGPLGEFSFIIAQLGVSTAVLPPSYYPLSVGVSIFTVLIVPMVNRHADAILAFEDRLQPGWLKRAQEAYHVWLSQVGASVGPASASRLIRERVTQIALEMLLITGVMIFSRQVLGLLVRQADAFGVEPETTRWVFWIAITVIVLVPLVAVWRNVATVAMIIAESLRLGSQLEAAIKGIAAVVLGFWLYALLPTDQLGAWGWIVIGIAAAVFVGFFSKRLIYWHSQWQSSVREVLETDADAAVLPASEQTRRRLGPRLDTWAVRLGECILPDGATAAGRTLAELSIPSEFGCAILEVERNGIVITAIRPDLRLYPGDKLLLLGQTKQIDAACEFLSREKALDDQAEEFRGSVLETFHVPTGPWDGRTLAELKLAQITGVRVVGIHRGSERVIAPSGEERLHVGDDVLVAGTLKEIASFRRWLTPPAVAEGGPALPTSGDGEDRDFDRP